VIVFDNTKLLVLIHMSGERVSWVWRFHQISLRMVGSNCQKCEIKHFPPREVCPDCGYKQDLPERHQVMREKPPETPAK
jgi:uncharacterized OB-fold protein